MPIRNQAVSIKARFKPKGRAHGYLGTISTVSDQYFLSSEENYRWGQANPPPQAGIGLKEGSKFYKRGLKINFDSIASFANF